MVSCGCSGSGILAKKRPLLHTLSDKCPAKSINLISSIFMIAKEDKAPELYPLLMMVNDRLELFIVI